MDNQYYRKTKLSALQKGDEFVYSGVEFELIYDEHAIMVGLTKEQFEGKRQVQTFGDLQDVLVPIQLPETVENNV